MDVYHSPGRLDQSILISAFPLKLPAHLAVRYAIYRFPILDGVVIRQNIRRRILGVVYHPVGIHSVEMVL